MLPSLEPCWTEYSECGRSSRIAGALLEKPLTAADVQGGMRSPGIARSAIAMIFALAACSSEPASKVGGDASDEPGRSAPTGEERSDAKPAPPARPAAVAPQSGAATGIGGTPSCRAKIGEAAAERLVAQCRAASPATRPPCNAANSCEMIRSEIARSCELFAETDPLPAELCSAARSDTPARGVPASVIRDYYSAIASHDYARAYGLWRNGGRASGKSLAAFERGFVDTVDTKVDVGEPSRPEGAAGSIYVTVPVIVQATTGDGTEQRFKGRYVLRRANAATGASKADQAWRIDSASLKTTD